jgi:radical SAM superfamily enzyme YgiQ (UPF0313 family)
MTNLMNQNASFLSGFLASLPRDRIPPVIRTAFERIVFPKLRPENGRLRYATYGLRKIEAALLEAGIRVSILPSHSVRKLSDSVKAIGVSTMDPLGIGPATSTAIGLFGGTAFNRHCFEQMMKRLRELGRPIIVGGSGAWQFKLFPREMNRLGVDCVVVGDGEALAPKLFMKAIQGKKLPGIVEAEPYRIDSYNPLIKNPAFWGFVEISRGCDRHCQFCDPAMREYDWMPMDKILEEARVSVRGGMDTVTLHSEDIFRYGCNKGDWIPGDALVNLIARIKNELSPKNVAFTHGALASVAANPKNVERICDLLDLIERPSAVQVGVETGSTKLIERYMRGKPKPFRPDQWPDIVAFAFEILTRNGIFPAGTLVVGLPGEEQSDIVQTLDLVDRLREFPSVLVPLFFVPLGVLKQDRKFFVKFRDMADEIQELYVKCGQHILSWARRWASSWQGEMGTISKMILWLGGAIMFRASEAVTNNETVTKSRAFSWLVQEFAFYLGRGIQNRGKSGFSYKSFVAELRKRQSEGHYPLLDMPETSGCYNGKEILREDLTKTPPV